MKTSTPTEGLLRVAGYLRQFVCGLHGHDELLHFERGRMSLICVSCGYESPGWDVRGKTDRRAPDAAKSRAARLPRVA